MMDIQASIHTLKNRIDRTLLACGRHHVTLMAVSKTRTVLEIREAFEAGVRDFGENYLQEALPKIEALKTYPIVWHFIGPLQSNKIKQIASHFEWVHSVSSIATAKALHQHRSSSLAPLNICIQVNIDEEPSKSGVHLEALPELVTTILALSHLKLRGLMIIPKPSQSPEQSSSFEKTASIMNELNQKFHLTLDTLSMGMSDDFEHAILAGSTCIRIGTEIFGPRRPMHIASHDKNKV